MDTYQATDFAALEDYVTRFSTVDHDGDVMVRSYHGTYPFSLEMVICWLVKFAKGSYFCVSIDVEGINYYLTRNHQNELRIFAPKIHSLCCVKFSDAQLVENGNLTKDVPADLLILAPYFDQEYFTVLKKEELLEKEFTNQCKEIVGKAFPSFSVKHNPRSVPKKIKTGDLSTLCFRLETNRSGWDDQKIANLFFENKGHIFDALPTKLLFKKHLKRKHSIEVAINVEDLIMITVSCTYEFYTIEDYWITVGVFETKLDCLAKQSDIFDQRELFNWAKEWNIEAVGKEEICLQLEKAITKLT